MAKIGSLTADLKLESAAFIRDMRKAQQETARATTAMSRSMQGMQKSFAAVGSSLKGFIAGFVSVAGVRGFVSLARSAAEFADSIGDTAAALGISADALQRYRVAAGQADVSIEQVDNALKLFQKSLAKGAIQDESFEAFIQRIREAPDQIAKVAIAQEGLSKQFQVGILLAQQSAEDFSKFYSNAATVSQQAIDNADTLTKQWELLSDALTKGFAEGFLEGFTGDMKLTTDQLNAFMELAKGLGSLAASMVGWLGMIAQAFMGVGSAISSSLSDLEAWVIAQRNANAARMIERGAIPGEPLPGRGGTPSGAFVGPQQFTETERAAAIAARTAAEQAKLAQTTYEAAAANDKLNESWKRGTKVIEEELSPGMQELNSTLQAMGSAVASAFANAIVEGEKLSEVLEQLLEQLAKMAINAVLQYLISGAIGGAGAGTNAGSGILGALFHGGGVVGRGGPLRNVPAGLFAGAPRLHNGLMPGEFPAILQRGESVIPKGGRGININVIDKNDSDVKVNTRESDNGDIDIELLIDQIASKKVSQPGSATNRALAQMGVRAAGIRR